VVGISYTEGMASPTKITSELDLDLPRLSVAQQTGVRRQLSVMSACPSIMEYAAEDSDDIDLPLPDWEETLIRRSTIDSEIPTHPDFFRCETGGSTSQFGIPPMMDGLETFETNVPEPGVARSPNQFGIPPMMGGLETFETNVPEPGVAPYSVSRNLQVAAAFEAPEMPRPVLPVQRSLQELLGAAAYPAPVVPQFPSFMPPVMPPVAHAQAMQMHAAAVHSVLANVPPEVLLQFGGIAPAIQEKRSRTRRAGKRGQRRRGQLRRATPGMSQEQIVYSSTGA